MTILRAPVEIRGDMPGLLVRGVLWRVANMTEDVPADLYGDDCRDIRLDWTSPLAPYAALHWLADRGHPCLWMLPTTHGGRVEAWDGLTAWEVSAILVSVSVGRVARGKSPVNDLFVDPWRDNGRCFERKSRHRESTLLVAYTGQRLWSGFGWDFFGEYKPSGPETGDPGKLAADRAALADGAALCVDGGILAEVP